MVKNSIVKAIGELVIRQTGRQLQGRCLVVCTINWSGGFSTPLNPWGPHSPHFLKNDGCIQEAFEIIIKPHAMS